MGAVALCLLALVSCRSSTPLEAGQEPPAHRRGVDADGRIPKGKLPPDLPNPDRWRYKPEGRISEKGIFERLFTSTFITPFLFFEGDVGTGAGLGFTDLDFRNKRRQEFANASISYTSEGQQNYRMFWRRILNQRDLDGGGVIQEERSYVQVSAGYNKSLTRRFFGLGAQTQETDETSFTDEVTSVGVKLQQSFPEVGGDWVYGVGARLEHRNLDSGFVSTVPSTEISFPDLVENGDGLDSLWLDAHLRYDTRDSQANPYRGAMLLGWARGTPLMTGGRRGIIYGARASWVTPVPPLFHSGGDLNEENPPTDVLAFVLDVTDSSGDLPFWSLPSLGGSDRLRGYVPGRFVDRALWFAGAEYRLVAIKRGMQLTKKVRIERFGLALFYGIGSVAEDLSSLGSSRTWTTYGLGGRVNLERAATFRADMGFGEDSTQFSLTFGLSF